MPEDCYPENKPSADQHHELKTSGLTYYLIHGSFQDDWCWHRFQPELEALGHQTSSVVLPFDSKHSNYETWADIAAEHIDDPPNAVVVPTSRMSNIGARIALRKAVHQIIYVCPGFDPSNNGELKHRLWSKVPDKYHPGYQAGISIDKDSGMATLDPAAAIEVLYHDCPLDLANEAIMHLRPMHRAVNQPPIPDWTDTPAALIYGADDRIIRKEYTQYISRSKQLARNLGKRVFELAGGHSPHLSRPFELAHKIDKATIK